MSLLKKLKKEIKIKTASPANILTKPGKKTQKKQAQEEEIKIKDEEWFKIEGELAVDVYQKGEKVVVEAPIAGVKPEELDITIEDDTIKIKGKRNRPQEMSEQDFLLQECYWGPFSREIILPFAIDGEKAEASMEEGILTIKVPKIERERKTKLKVKEK